MLLCTMGVARASIELEVTRNWGVGCHSRSWPSDSALDGVPLDSLVST